MSLPLGLYEQLLTDKLAALLPAADATELFAQVENLDPAEAPRILARHAGAVIEASLRATRGDDALARQVGLVNELLALITTDATADQAVASEGRALYAVGRRDPLAGDQTPARPLIPLGATDLLVNGEREPRVGHQVAAELESADAVDLLCAFVRWEGLRVLVKPLERLLLRGAPVRVLTTTYMGVTQPKALDELVRLGAQVRVCYERHATRLHAKAWMLHRETGYSTAYVGSSNLSRSALLDGMEWNVRLSQVETPAVLAKFRATFDEYWESETFEPYDRERFERELSCATPDGPQNFALLDVRPTHWQEQVLYQLQVERERHGRWRNLVVAATGTGKTVLAALDYRRLRQLLGGDPSLLFVAHRREILQQSLATFRAVLRDPSFGELFVGGDRPSAWRHVFASVQSLGAMGVDQLPPDRFDVVVVDEFHHAAADSYRRLLDRLEPKVLLGLTATPERADGQDIRQRFDGRFAAELRVWTAIEEGWLCPFQYFGVADSIDLSGLTWQRGGYVTAELDQLITGDDVRVGIVLGALRNIVDDVRSMRALGFCVSVTHAEYMARRFVDAGIAAEAVSAGTSLADRDAALRRLRSGDTKVLFSVDLFNEGVDVPDVDTILLLRPTESATVFLQQLGRGLRWAEGKAVCTVIDLIGQQHRQFRWDLRLRALTGTSRAQVQRHAEEGFPYLPPGCHIQLDRVAEERVLSQIRQALRVDVRTLEAELRSLGDVDLGTFLREAVLEPEDLYRSGRWWSALRRRVGLPVPAAGPDEDAIGRSLSRLLHIDDPRQLTLYRRLLGDPAPPWLASMNDAEGRLLAMLLWDVFGDAGQRQVQQLWAHPALRAELADLFTVLDERANHLAIPAGPGVAGPLTVHARYSVKAALAGLAVPSQRIKGMREGVLWHEASRTDVFFVTLRKSERDYSPTTLYRDHAISPTLFHWESQSTTAAQSPTGVRYLTGASTVLLFARESKDDGRGGTRPYLFLGPATYVAHEGSRPIAFTWRLRHALPPDFFSAAKVAAG